MAENVNLDTSQEEVRYEKMESAKIVETSDYAQVIFLNVAKMYPIDAHIECRYKITAAFTPNKWDWIGLYKVGWMSPSDKLHYEWAPLPAKYEPGQENESHQLFQAHNLPKDDGEFYQFAYINSSGQVRGASTPFMFKRPGADDFVECEDPDLDMLVISSKTVVLEETIFKLQEEIKDMSKTKLALDAERDGIIAKMVAMTTDLSQQQQANQTLNKKVQEYERKIETLNTEARDMGVILEALKEKLETVTKERDELEMQLQEKQIQMQEVEQTVKSLKNEVDKCEGQVKMLQEEKELFKNHFTTSEEKTSAFQKEIENLKLQLITQTAIVVAQSEELNMVKSEVEKERKKLGRQISVSRTDQEMIASLTERYQNAQDKLEAMEKCKAMLNSQLMALQEAHDQMANNMEKSKTEAHSWKIRLAKMEEKHKKNVTQLDTEKEKTTELLAQLEMAHKNNEELSGSLEGYRNSSKTQVNEGSVFALQEAYSSLKQRHADLCRKYKAVKDSKRKTQKDTEHELRRENEDMKERLDMAKEEYITLYKQNRRTQLELEKLQRQNALESTGSDTEDAQTVSVTNPDLVELSSIELQTQLDDLGHELEQRRAKTFKYKLLYRDERTKNELLRQHYHEELAKLKEALEKNDKEYQDFKAQSEVCLHADSYTTGAVQPTAALPPLTYPEGSSLPRGTMYPNPYLSEQVCPPPRPPPPTQAKSCRDSSPLDETAPVKLEEPMTPLQAPLVPQVLPSAKVAAVKHAAGFQSSSSESSLNENDFLGENMITSCDDLNTAAPSAPPVEFEDNDEDRFHDAVGDPQRICPVCGKVFGADILDKEMQEHVETHFGLTCPMCNRQFNRDNITTDEFEAHVQGHFQYD